MRSVETYEDKLRELCESARQEWMASGDDSARERFHQALNQFSDFVLRGVIGREDFTGRSGFRVI